MSLYVCSRGQILVADSNRTPFVYVVKTGKVKVVRSQSVLDINACESYTVDAKKRPDDPLNTQTTLTTHADGKYTAHYTADDVADSNFI